MKKRTDYKEPIKCENCDYKTKKQINFRTTYIKRTFNIRRKRKKDLNIIAKYVIMVPYHKL